MNTIKPISLGTLCRVAMLQRRWFFALGAIAAFRLDDPTRLLPETAFWKAIGPFLNGAVFDQAMPKPQAEVMVFGTAYAPGATPVQVMDIGFRVGPIQRQLRVFGDRYWQDTGTGIYPTDPSIFQEMRLSAARAFGGPNFPENPAGRGHASTELLDMGMAAPLANLEDPDHPVREITDTPDPILLGPIDMNAPSRRQMAGSYDQHWVRDWYPGLPPDADMHLFQSAQPVQRHAEFFQGDEEIALSGFRPGSGLWRSRLPNMRVRAFVQQQDGLGGASTHEVALRIDTVCLFPDAGIGCAIYRGLKPVLDPDGNDISVLLLGYEKNTDQPRPVEHYQEQLRLRTDEATKGHYVLREGPLKPVLSPAEVEQRRAAKERKRAELVTKTQMMLGTATKQMAMSAGVPMGLFPQLEMPDLSAVPVITDEEIEALDIDFGEIWEGVDQILQSGVSEADQHILAAMKGEAPPNENPPDEIVEILQAIQASRDPAAMAQSAVNNLTPEMQALFDDAVADHQSAPAPDLEDSWRQLELRLRRDISEHPLMVAVRDIEIPEMDHVFAEASGPNGRSGVTTPKAEGQAQPPKMDDIEALLGEFSATAAPSQMDGGLGGATPSAADKVKQALEAALPGLAHLPPGEALGALQGIVSAGQVPADKGSIDAILAYTREQVAALARGDALADARRMSPVSIADEWVWNPAFAARLTALIAELRGTPEGLAGRDFAGVRMPGLVLAGEDMAGSFWEKAVLHGANFARSKLNKAAFTEADLSQADFSDADLSEASLFGAKIDATKFCGVSFSNGTWINMAGKAADFSTAKIVNTSVMECKFPGMRAIGATFQELIFVECDFAQANFSHASFDKCIFMKCDLTALRAIGAKMEACCFIDCPMEGADFTDAQFTNVAALLGQFKGARFRRLRADRFSLHAADLTGADFAGANMPGVTLLEAKLSGASFLRARLRQAAMGAMQADGADFTGADLFQAQLRRSSLQCANFFGANLAQADMDGVEIMQADFTGANLLNTALERPSQTA